VSLQAKIRLYEDHAKDCVEVAGRTDNAAHREILLKDGPRLDEGRGRAASREAVVAAGRGRRSRHAWRDLPEQRQRRCGVAGPRGAQTAWLARNSRNDVSCQEGDRPRRHHSTFTAHVALRHHPRQDITRNLRSARSKHVQCSPSGHRPPLAPVP